MSEVEELRARVAELTAERDAERESFEKKLVTMTTEVQKVLGFGEDGLRKTQELKAAFATEREDLQQQLEGKALEIRILQTQTQSQEQEYANKVAIFTTEIEKMQQLGIEGAAQARKTGGHIKELEAQVEDLTAQLKAARAGDDKVEEGQEASEKTEEASGSGNDGKSTTARERWLQERVSQLEQALQVEQAEYGQKVQMFVSQIEQLQQIGKVGLEGAKRAREAEAALRAEVEQLTAELEEAKVQVQQLQGATTGEGRQLEGGAAAKAEAEHASSASQ
eukprot:g945.t1